MKEELLKQFQNPDSLHRSFPFWGWNGMLDKEELVNQVREMKAAGIGGFFIHSRDGLETEYLGEEWMECVKAVVEEAKALGMCVWLYDEDRFPAGTAGGRVPAGGDAYRCKGLCLEVMAQEEYARLYEQEIAKQSSLSDDEIGFVTAYAAVVEGDMIQSARRLTLQRSEAFAEGEVLLAVRLLVSAPSEWFNYETPPDNLNPDCTRRFIAETHEKYKQAVGQEFGKTIQGIFTDEPSIHDRHCYFGEKQAWIPWTFGYGAYFKELLGYDFLEVLPWFYFHGEKSPKARHDYWYSISKRFGESYFKVIGEWCEQNHLAFTGHFLQEDKMGLAVRVNGAVMPNYQYQHIPGIDMLGEQTGEYMTIKQCTSVARQLGKKNVLTETYGCTGWEFTFEGQKWMGDWQYVLGVNRRCQHMALYSLRGCRKRDYPPSFNYNTNWWNYNAQVEDYFARFAVAAEQGKAVADILLLHPVSTVWSRLGSSPYGNPSRKNERDIPGLNQFGDKFNQLIAELLQQHLDVDLGDEILMEQYGRAQDGAMKIGEMSYKAVVLPAGTKNLLESTWKLLYAYLEQGGKIYAIRAQEAMLQLVSGSSGTSQQEELLNSVTTHSGFIWVQGTKELVQALEHYRTISITNGQGEECREILYQLRKNEEGYFLMLANNHRKKGARVTVTLPFHAVPTEMDLLSGEMKVTQYFQNTGHGLELQVKLEPSGSAVYYLKPCQVKKVTLTQATGFSLDRPNVLPLDFCKYRMDGGEWSEEMEIWQAQQQVREALNMRQIHHNGLEQRYKWIDKPHPGDGHRVELLFTFEADEEIKEEGLMLAVEQLERFDVQVNGRKIPVERKGYLLDKSFETMAIDSLWAGRNEMILGCTYTNDMELENCYLAGDFGVTPDRQIQALPKELPLGDWTMHGLKHYCGSVTWKFRYESDGEAEQILLKLPECRAVCVEIQVNGQVQFLPWNNVSELEIGQWIRKGDNEVALKLVGSPRNMMGPFHLQEKPGKVNDAAFCPKPEKYNREYLLEPYGMMGCPEVIELSVDI